MNKLPIIVCQREVYRLNTLLILFGLAQIMGSTHEMTRGYTQCRLYMGNKCSKQIQQGTISFANALHNFWTYQRAKYQGRVARFYGTSIDPIGSGIGFFQAIDVRDSYGLKLHPFELG